MAKQNILFPSLNTPAVLVDLDKLEANIREMSQLAAEAGVRLRPHVKVHECASIAKLQIEAGACGVEVGSVEQAEGMAEEGINDVIIAHPFYGSHKLEILERLLNKKELKLAVVVDMIEQAKGISQVGQAVGRKVHVLLKIDLGKASRYGVSPGEAALEITKKLRQLPGIEFMGIYGHEIGGKPTEEGVSEAAFEAATMMTRTAELLRKGGISVEHVSTGASPTFRATCRYLKEGKFPEITEIHPGQCVIGDIMYMKAFGNKRETCAVTVLTSVMSTSHANHAVIDAGYKCLGAESIISSRDEPGFFWEGRPSFGSVQGRPDLWFGRLSAETSCIYYMDTKKRLSLGERLEIVPNNATLVINIHERLYGVRNGILERVFPVTGRGRGN